MILFCVAHHPSRFNRPFRWLYHAYPLPPSAHPLLRSRPPPPRSYRSEPCPTLRNSHAAAAIFMRLLPRSLPNCTLMRKATSLGDLRAQYSMVHYPIHSFIVSHHIHSIYHYRDRYRPILPVHGRLVQPNQPHRERYQAATRGSHCGHVLVCDGIHRPEPLFPIHFLCR